MVSNFNRLAKEDREFYKRIFLDNLDVVRDQNDHSIEVGIDFTLPDKEDLNEFIFEAQEDIPFIIGISIMIAGAAHQKFIIISLYHSKNTEYELDPKSTPYTGILNIYCSEEEGKELRKLSRCDLSTHHLINDPEIVKNKIIDFVRKTLEIEAGKRFVNPIFFS